MGGRRRSVTPRLGPAARVQPDTKPDVVSYSCTSGSIVIGEERVMAEIKRGAPWARPMCILTGVVDALRELGAKKLVVGTPCPISMRSMRRKRKRVAKPVGGAYLPYVEHVPGVVAQVSLRQNRSLGTARRARCENDQRGIVGAASFARFWR